MMQIFHFEELPSTQDKVFELFQSKTQAPFVVVADRQTKGRGRLGREWISETGRSLTLSYGCILPTKNLEALSLIVGLGVRDRLHDADVKLKWPNDLMIEEKKVGGILVESRSQGDQAQVAIGVGLNLLSLQSAPYFGINQKVAAEEVAGAIESRLNAFINGGFGPFQREYESVLWNKGQTVTLKIDDEKKEVRILGVSDRGWLKTEHNGELFLSDQGEILVGS